MHTASTDLAAANGDGTSHAKNRFWALTLGSIGVVYGDIGTSPLYAVRESVLAAVGPGTAAQEIMEVDDRRLQAVLERYSGLPTKAAARQLDRRLALHRIVRRQRAELDRRRRSGHLENFPREIGGVKFQPAEARMLEALYRGSELTMEALLAATHDPKDGDDDREVKVVDVWLCKMRPKLAQIDLVVKTIWGGKRALDAASKGRLRELLREAGAEA